MNGNRPDLVSRERVLFSPLTLDRFVDEGMVVPGGGAINIAWHWARAGLPARVVSRIGDDASPLFLAFLGGNGIRFDAESLVSPGITASIDIAVGRDNQPVYSNYVQGVWSDLALAPAEELTIGRAASLHTVLVPAVTRELLRLGEAGILDGVEVSGDFLDYRYCDEGSFAAMMRHVDVGFVGWPGGAGDGAVAGMRRVAFGLRRLVVVTLGSAGALALDGAAGREAFYPADAVTVTGSTIGCGDAFIAAFLAERSGHAGLDAAMKAGNRAGAAATAWRRALPDDAYAALT